MKRIAFARFSLSACLAAAIPSALPGDRPPFRPSPLASETRTIVGPGGGWMRGFAVDPTDPKVIYAVSYNRGQVFRSSDAGASWTSLAAFEDTLLDVAVAPSDPDRIYALGSEGIFASADGGSTWEDRRFGENRRSLGQIAVHSRDADEVSVAGEHNFNPADYWSFDPAVFQSRDAGRTWTMIKPAGRTFRGSVTTLTQSKSRPSVIYAGGSYSMAIGDARPALWRSDNGGRTWKNVYPPGGAYSPTDIVVDPDDHDRVFAAAYKSVWRSSDGGKTWSESSLSPFLTFNQKLSALVMDAAQPSTLYTSGDGIVFRSADGGAHWARSSDLIRTVEDFLSCPGMLLAATRTGSYRSVDKARSWKAGHKGLAAADVWTLAVGPAPSTGALPARPAVESAAAAPAAPSSHVVYAGVGFTGLFRSDDGGGDWVKKWAPRLKFKDVGVVLTVTAHPRVANMVFAQFGECGFSGLYRSLDGGTTFGRVVHDGVWRMAFSRKSERMIWGTGYSVSGHEFGFFSSQDTGKSWKAERKFGYAGCGMDIAVSPANERNLIMAGYTSGSWGGGRLGGLRFRGPDSEGYRSIILQSADGGARWVDGSQGLQGTVIYGLAIDPKAPDRVVAAGDAGVFKRENAGESWSRVLTGDFRGVAFRPGAAGVVYAGGTTGLFVSRDGGKTWKDASEGMMVKYVNSLEIDPAGKALYVGLLGGSIFKIVF